MFWLQRWESTPSIFREMNCYKESEGSTIPTGYPPEVYCEEELFKTARPLYEAAKKRVAEKNAASDGKIKYGIGVSLGVYGCGLDGVDTSNCICRTESGWNSYNVCCMGRSRTGR